MPTIETPKKPTNKSDFLKKFEMSETDDLDEEEEEHIHQEGCCSCHSNIGS